MLDRHLRHTSEAHSIKEYGFVHMSWYLYGLSHSFRGRLHVESCFQDLWSLSDGSATLARLRSSPPH